MKKNLTIESTRRGFLKSLGRILAGGGLAGLSILLLARKSDSKEIESCKLQQPCRDCQQLSHCHKDQASAYKKQKNVNPK